MEKQSIHRPLVPETAASFNPARPRPEKNIAGEPGRAEEA